MLHCNMISTTALQLGLDDLLADLRHARRGNDLGRLALLAYCEVRRWARSAGESELARHAAEMVTTSPQRSREDFLEHIDSLIHELEDARPRLVDPSPFGAVRGSGRAGPASHR
jgi:hypothetical protein